MGVENPVDSGHDGIGLAASITRVSGGSEDFDGHDGGAFGDARCDPCGDGCHMGAVARAVGPPAIGRAHEAAGGVVVISAVGHLAGDIIVVGAQSGIDHIDDYAGAIAVVGVTGIERKLGLIKTIETPRRVFLRCRGSDGLWSSNHLHAVDGGNSGRGRLRDVHTDAVQAVVPHLLWWSASQIKHGANPCEGRRVIGENHVAGDATGRDAHPWAAGQHLRTLGRGCGLSGCG